MSKLINNINIFINSELTNFLDKLIDKESTSKFKFNYSIVEKSDISANVNLQNNHIELSRGHVIKQAILLSIIDQTWKDTSGSRIFTFDLEHPIETTLYYNKETLNDSFQLCPELKFLFTDVVIDNDNLTLVENFPDQINIGNIKSIKLPDKLNHDIETQLILWFSFVILHEIGHIKKYHETFMSLWLYKDIDEISLTGSRINEYKSKAIEIDADCYAFARLITSFFDSIKDKNACNYFISNLYRSVAFGISVFDVSRKSVFEYRGQDNLYPMPEIRYYFMCRHVKEVLQLNNPNMTFDLDFEYEKAVNYTVRTFQSLGIKYGPFYYIAGKLTSLSCTFMKDLILAQSIEDELNKIIMQFNFLIPKHMHKFKIKDWKYQPFGYAKDKLESEKERALENMLNNNNLDPDEIIKSSLEKIKTKYKITKKDSIVIYQSDSRESRVMDHKSTVPGFTSILKLEP